MKNKRVELEEEDLLSLTTEELLELFKQIENAISYLRTCILDVNGEEDDE
ncbi:MAG: hypothetical protein PHN42_03070 [Bacilli bacterium]|nr:hypothetical protein [Bacilli bacterium]